MSETDNDRPELDPSVPVEKLAHLIQHAAELQVKICMWRVRDTADFRFLLSDVRSLELDLKDLRDHILYERNKMGLGGVA